LIHFWGVILVQSRSTYSILLWICKVDLSLNWAVLLYSVTNFSNLHPKSQNEGYDLPNMPFNRNKPMLGGRSIHVELILHFGLHK
jgi:hypothetical protein